MALGEKQARFVAEYLKDLNATQAALRAGYSTKTAYAQGSRLLRHAEVRAAIADGKREQLEAADLSATRVLEELRRVAFYDMRAFYDEHGNMRPAKDWTAEQGAVLSSFEVIKKNAAAGDGVIDTVHKIKLCDKMKALETLAKHFGLLTDKVEHSGALEIAWRSTESSE